MSTRSRSVARLAGLLALLCAGAGPVGAADPPKPSAPPAPKDVPAPQGTKPQATRPAPPQAPAPFRPSEDVSPGRKLSFPNDI
jgi:hypothetical protein